MNEIDLMRRIDALEKRIKDLETHEGNNFSALNISPGSIDLNNGNLYGTTPANIDDDAAISFTPANSVGMILIFRRSQTTSTTWGLIAYRTISTHTMAILVGGSNTEVTTGALAGTTGTDTKMTVSSNDADGKIYIENRRGAAISIHYVLFGA